MRGTATAKLLSPRVVRVRGSASVLCRKMSGDDDDHAQRRVECRQIGIRRCCRRNRLVCQNGTLNADKFLLTQTLIEKCYLQCVPSPYITGCTDPGRLFRPSSIHWVRGVTTVTMCSKCFLVRRGAHRIFFQGGHRRRKGSVVITGVWGRAPSGVQGQSPWSGGQDGGEAPLKLKAFWPLDVQRSRKI